jgi:hypothetical protein
MKPWTQKLRDLQYWKLLPDNDWWRHSRLRRFSTYCSELMSVWISDSAIVTSSYNLYAFTNPSYGHSIKSWQYILILSSHLQMSLPNGLFPSYFLPKNFVISHCSHSCYIPHTFHSPWFDYSKLHLVKAEIMGLLLMQFSMMLFPPLGPNIFSTLLSNTCSLCSEWVHNGEVASV